MTFDNCQLNHAIFYKLNLKGNTFRNCQLLEVDFAECDLNGVVFNNCDLSGAVFYQSNLEGVDFRTALNFTINPDENRMKNSKFSLEGLPGLLTKFGIQVS
jgi:fluoroquinolone resistance protein